MFRSSRFVPALVAAVLSTGAMAQDQPAYDLVDLSASAERDIANDLLIAIVFAEVEANRQADAAAQVNEAIRWAAERARDINGIELQTSQYTTRPVYASSGRSIVRWVARQTLRLESKDQDALGALLGQLQERVAIQSISYAVSKAARDAAEDALIAEALGAFNRRAALVAAELGRPGVRIVRINVGTSGGNPIAYREIRSLAVADNFAAPEIEAGVQTLSVSVNGTVELESDR